MLLGGDTDGLTDLSLKSLKEIYDRGFSLEEVRIRSKCPNETRCVFVFNDGYMYEASGFSIGYGGTGPHGLWKAIKMFCPNEIENDFWNTGINKLEFGNWKWKPHIGFIRN